MSQENALYEILKDGEKHFTVDITNEMFGTAETARTGLFRLGARISGLKDQGHRIIGGWGERNGVRCYYYQLLADKQIEGYEEAAKKIIENPKFGDREFLDILKDITEIHRAKRNTEVLDRKRKRVIWYANEKLGKIA